MLLVAAGIAAALAFPGAGETVDTLPLPVGADHANPGQVVRLVRVQIEENISVADTVRALPPARVTVSETVTVSDAVQVPQTVSIVIQESISVADVASPPAAAAASEAISVTDQVTFQVSARLPLRRPVRLEVREELTVSDALDAAGAIVTPQIPPAVSVIIEEQITVEHPGLDGTPPAARPTPTALPAASPTPPAARPTPTALDPVSAPPSAADGEGLPDPAQPVPPTPLGSPLESEPEPGIPADTGADQALVGVPPEAAAPAPAPDVSSVAEAPADEEAPPVPLTGPGGGCGFMGPLSGVSLEPALLLGFIGMLLFVRRLGRGAGRPPGPAGDEPSRGGQTEQ